MADPTSDLFVYGTLMGDASGNLGQTERDRLRAESTSVGPATMPGKLYDLGQYPGLVIVHGGGAVQGEIITLFDPDRTFAWLDLYEGVEPSQSSVDGFPSPEFVRRPVAAALYNGEPCRVWVYAYIGPLRGARFLPEARWTGRNI